MLVIKINYNGDRKHSTGTSSVWHIFQTLSPRTGMMQYISGAVE